MREYILPADTFIVVNNTLLNDSDRKVLTMLYQPILGGSAINLFFSLWSYLDKSEIISREWTHHHLISSMHVSLDEVLISRNKLEAIGLIKTYFNEEINNYIYELYSPLTPKQFLESPILAETLESNVGEVEFKNIIEYFRIPKIDKKGYVNITKKFRDVFEPVASNYYDNLIDDVKNKNTNDIKIDFDIESIIELIPDDLLNKKAITKELIEYIKKLSFLYNYTEDTISKLIRNSIDEKKQISKIKLRNNYKKYYQFENSGKAATIIYKNQPENLRNDISVSSKRDKLINQFETISPFHFLTAKNNGVNPTKSDMEILEYLLTELKLTPGVVNVLIDYVLKINDNKLTKSYVYTIASQWKRYNVKTVMEAMELANKEYKKSKKIKPHKSKEKEAKPDWFDHDIKEEVATTLEIEEMDKLLSQYE